MLYAKGVVASILLLHTVQAMASDTPPSCSRDADCADKQMKCTYGKCLCIDDLQLYINGTCKDPAGVYCDVDAECLPGSSCVGNECVCSKELPEELDTGICMSVPNGFCVHKINCPDNLDCIKGTCQCPGGKKFMPESTITVTTISGYWSYTKPVAAGCRIVIGKRCDRNTVHSDYAYPSSTNCITGYCDKDTYRCACPESSTVNEDGTICTCGGDSYSQGNLCLGYTNAVINATTNLYQCPSGTTANSATQSCDCKIDKATYNTQTGLCECSGTSKSFDATGKKCICKGASSMDFSNNCERYYYATINSANQYMCPTGTTKTDATKSCECPSNLYYSSYSNGCVAYYSRSYYYKK